MESMDNPDGLDKAPLIHGYPDPWIGGVNPAPWIGGGSIQSIHPLTSLTVVVQTEVVESIGKVLVHQAHLIISHWIPGTVHLILH